MKTEMDQIFNLRIQVIACRRDIRRNGDAFIGFYNRTLKSKVLAMLRQKLWMARMKAAND